MKIELLEAGLYNVPLQVPLSDSTHGQMPHFELITVRLGDDQGLTGLGYTYTVGRGGGAILSLIRKDLAPVLLGQDPRRIERLWQAMWWALHYSGRGGQASLALSALDVALWDLAGKRTGEPWWRLLGGCRDRVKVYAGGVDLHFSLEELLEQHRRYLELGFGAVKMKVGRESLAEDLSRVAALREAIGPEVPLMVDANMGWSVDRAVRASRALAELDVYWLEEPTDPDDVRGHRRIAQRGALPLALGENLHTVAEFQRYIAAGAVDFPEPDLSNCGGVTAWLKIARLAEAFNLPVTSHGVHDLHVHLLAAVPNASYLEGHGFGLEAYLAEPLRIEAGFAYPPLRPGHGVELDWDRLSACRED